jgi:hypothetical protein
MAPQSSVARKSLAGRRYCSLGGPHSGKYCYGKTPMQTFLDSKRLSDEKQLDRTSPTVNESRVGA